MPFSWDDRVTVITGASSGIGRELALLLDKLGARLVINARREDKLRAVADQCNRPPTIIAGDITQPATQAEIIKFCRDTWDRMDVLINNAGVGAIGKFEQATPERLRQIMEVNFFAVAELTRNAIPLLKNGNDRPTIANLCSVLGHRAVPLKSEYCASKFAIHGFSDSLRAELVGDRIHVLLVSPSTTDSEFFDSLLEDASGKNPTLAKPMNPRLVAAATIRAIERGRHEVILPWSGKFLVWLDRIWPALADRMVARYGN